MTTKRKAIIAAIIILLLAASAFSIFKKEVQAPTRQNSNQPLEPAPKQASKSGNIAGEDEILKNALNLYLEKKREGVDMSNGPCLGKIADDWVLDIAHNPRQAIDNKPENQCADFRNGLVHHFIELDPDGKLITRN